MGRAARLKVYRTPMGFYDAVVAAPSQSAALKAWGVSGNLFAEGLAEEVRGDETLLAEASASPGKILRKPRGDAAQLLTQAPKGAVDPPSPKVLKAKPDRSKLDAAEEALAKARSELDEELRAIVAERKALDGRERQVRRKGETRVVEAESVRAREEKAFMDAS